MKAIYIVLILHIFFNVFAQTEATGKVFDIVEQMPGFPGGETEMSSFIGRNVRYPDFEWKSNIQGRVIVKFIIDTDGTIKDPLILKPVSPGLDSEAMRIVHLMPKFTPGYQAGKAVKVYYSLPFLFKLEDKSNGEHDKIYQFVEQQPLFPGGDAALMQAIKKNIHYPEDAKAKGIEGKVLIKFVVNTDGSVSSAEIIKSLAPDLDKEAIRVVSMLPKFIPGKQQGRPVKVYFNIPVIFKLNDFKN